MLIYLITGLTIISSIFVISTRSPIHSIIALISVVLNIVILSIFLEAEFLALSFVAVYLGAVTVLFLFIVMMLNIKGIDFRKGIIRALPIGFFFGLILVYFLYNSFNHPSLEGDSIGNIFITDIFFDWQSIMFNIPNVNVIGSVLYSHFSPYLLMVGIVLLIAMIGVMVLTKTSYLSMGAKRDFIDQQVSRNFNNAVFLINDKKKFN